MNVTTEEARALLSRAKSPRPQHWGPSPRLALSGAGRDVPTAGSTDTPRPGPPWRRLSLVGGRREKRPGKDGPLPARQGSSLGHQNQSSCRLRVSRARPSRRPEQGSPWLPVRRPPYPSLCPEVTRPPPGRPRGANSRRRPSCCPSGKPHLRVKTTGGDTASRAHRAARLVPGSHDIPARRSTGPSPPFSKEEKTSAQGTSPKPP